MNRFLLMIFSVAVLITACDRDNKSDYKLAVCIEEFRYGTILIRHSSDLTSVILTDYKVIRISDNKDLTLPGNVFPVNSGYYSLVNDDQLNILRNSITEIEFQGDIQNTMVIKSRFDVGTDCCYLSPVSGEAVSYINLHS
jgi:hypothetical protein